MIYEIFIIPFMIFIIGFWMFKYPLKKPNWFVRYRTRNSIKDNDIWELANKYCGKIAINIGIIILAITILLSILVYFKFVMLTEH